MESAIGPIEREEQGNFLNAYGAADLNIVSFMQAPIWSGNETRDKGPWHGKR